MMMKTNNCALSSVFFKSNFHTCTCISSSPHTARSTRGSVSRLTNDTLSPTLLLQLRKYYNSIISQLESTGNG